MKLEHLNLEKMVK